MEKGMTEKYIIAAGQLISEELLGKQVARNCVKCAKEIYPQESTIQEIVNKHDIEERKIEFLCTECAVKRMNRKKDKLCLPETAIKKGWTIPEVMDLIEKHKRDNAEAG